ncbi:MAG: AAA family ATPase [Chloroflexi bacterium]|nr:AAA family ATPase [Chloroflexota bacterium]
MTWYEANQNALNAEMARITSLLVRHIGQETDMPAVSASGGVSALDVLTALFDLSSFERDIVVLCAGIELQPDIARLCAEAHGNPNWTYPTFGLALASLPGAHWSALTPGSPLRRWNLIVMTANETLTRSPIRLDERILHYLAGVAYTDQRLSAYLQASEVEDELVPSHQVVAERIAAVLMGDSHSAVQVCGDDPNLLRAIAVSAYRFAGVNVLIISARTLPTHAADLDALARLLDRESLLNAQGIIIECDDERAESPALQFAERLSERVILTTRERQTLHGRAAPSFNVRQPESRELRTVWEHAIGDGAAQLNGKIDALISQFRLSPSAIRTVATEGRTDPDSLWDVCRAYARPRVEDLAQRIDTHASWNDLVLPDAQLSVLHEIAIHVRQRMTVYEAWGFGARSPRGLGISALFAGQSGTGKTLAAEVLANELKLDLYRIDLSQVVSKYIGETEKNLRRIFSSAEQAGAILLFDEADALFGKRSEVKDSHDRYANIEVSYLLQLMELYRGLAILTTNLKSALDTAFLRRLRFIVQFPFPDALQRAEIWRRIFPAATPTDGLDYHRLARLNVAGGTIRNIALNSAFLAAEQGETVQMKYLLMAARGEYAKLEKMLTEAETTGWV